MTCHQMDIMSMKAITSKANVFKIAHITVRPMYMDRNTPRGAK
eukprot:Gb_38307 [translate_table: standard]